MKKTLAMLCFVALAACSDDTSSNSAANNPSSNNPSVDASKDGTTGSDSTNDSTTSDTSGDTVGGGTDSASDTPVDSPFETNDIGQVLCGDVPCQCSDGLDNDGNGLIDGLDPECTGPYDDDESSFATGISGDNKDPKWQDCFFDGNSGAGDDKCRYATACAEGTLPQDDPDCTVSDACLDNCRKLVPNGCDCFGCCDIRKDDGQVASVVIGTTCSIEEIDNPDKCTPCVKSDRCSNECGECELCFGKTVADLPAKCFPSTTPEDMSGDMPDTDMSDDMTTPTPPPRCENGEQVCDAATRCQDGFYCAQGCCIEIPL